MPATRTVDMRNNRIRSNVKRLKFVSSSLVYKLYVDGIIKNHQYFDLNFVSRTAWAVLTMYLQAKGYFLITTETSSLKQV